MLRLGVTLLFIGVLAFVLPLMNIQFRLITLLGDRPEIRIAFAAVGAVLIVIAKMRESSSARKQVLAAPPAFPPPQQYPPQQYPPQQYPMTPQGPPPSMYGGAPQQPPVAWAPPPPPPAAMGRTCRRCGNAMPPVNTFCTSCGTPLS